MEKGICCCFVFIRSTLDPFPLFEILSWVGTKGFRMFYWNFVYWPPRWVLLECLFWKDWGIIIQRSLILHGGDIKRLTSRADLALVSTGTPITPGNVMISLLVTISANSAHKVWRFQVSFSLLFFTRVPVYTLPNNDYAYRSHLMNPAVFSIVTWEDLEIPISTNYPTITGEEWLSPPSPLPVNTSDSHWTIDGSQLPFCITNSTNARICSYINIHWYIIQIIYYIQIILYKFNNCTDMLLYQHSLIYYTNNI